MQLHFIENCMDPFLIGGFTKVNTALVYSLVAMECVVGADEHNHSIIREDYRKQRCRVTDRAWTMSYHSHFRFLHAAKNHVHAIYIRTHNNMELAA